ncbi:MAG: alpha-hydroxy-acid oxidizing protein [Planctomycetes bacterium]|nr:alpha-hydroxy-acid oxidizing protein [Planctomycetota bacterium]
MTADPLADVVNLDDLEALARERLDAMTFDYYAGGAGDEVTLRENRAAFARLVLRYRVLRGADRPDPRTTVLGQELSLPALVAPTAFHGLAHPQGELATTRAAGAAGTVMVLSTLATEAVEDVVAAAAGPVWFQLYVYKDRPATEALVRRAEAAGCRALVLTVDSPRLGRRERDVRSRFHLPPHLRAKNLLPAGMADLGPDRHDSGLAAYFHALLDPALTWADVGWLRSISRLPLLVKGVVRGDDAARALDEGAHGVVVSNHGGRQLDGAPATLDVLPEVVDAVAGRGEVLLDGGVRRGADVLKALALGARAVLLGRPVLWGLAVGGEAGARRALELLRAEVELAMTLVGARAVDEVSRDLVAPTPR